MRYVAIAALAAGCASAGNPTNAGTSDADPQKIDGKVFEDAPAHTIDAAHHDAPIDSPPDAFVFLDACVPHATQLLQNAAFDLDAGGTGWVQQPVPGATGGPYYPITSVAIGPTPQSPAYKVFEGGLTGADTSGGTSATDALYQDVAIPAGTTQLVLTGYYIVGSTETTTTIKYDNMSMDLTQTTGTPIENVLAFSNLNAQTAVTWNFFTHTFASPAAIAGTTVRLHMTSTNDVSNNSNFFFDTLALTATHGCDSHPDHAATRTDFRSGRSVRDIA